VPSDFGARTPAIYGARGFLGVTAKENLKKLLAGVGTRSATPNVAVADVVLASPEEQQTNTGGHDVVVFDGDRQWFPNRAQDIENGLAVGSSRRRPERSEKKKEEQGQAVGRDPHPVTRLFRIAAGVGPNMARAYGTRC